MYYVYKHTNKENGKSYIGITRQVPKKRWQKGKGYVDNEHFTNAINKYGWDGFIHEILFSDLTKEQACQKEIELIAYYKSNNRDFGYNKSMGGDNLDCVTIKSGKDNPKSRRIRCFDLNHKYICKFDTQTEASEKLQINRKGITKCCLGQCKTYKGYIFEYDDVEYKKPTKYERGKHHNHRTRKVNMLDKKGNVIHTYPSMKIASEMTGYSANGIQKCCTGWLKTYHESRWCYAD